MDRRTLVLAAATWPGLSLAHHGWSSFDQDRPIWLEGKVTRVRWQNPHAELELAVAPTLRVPADLASRTLPAQSAPVDGKALLSRAVVPTRKDTCWQVELAPLTRLKAWNVAMIQPGAPWGCWASRSRRKRAIRSCAPSTCSPTARPTVCAAARLSPGLRWGRGALVGSGAQAASAARARAVISSTVPMPLMTRYFGALTGSALAQLA